MMQSSLSVEGFEVRTAASLSEARALLQHSAPDVVVLDLGLPDGDGLELVQLVRKTHSLPILIVSARHQEAQKIRLLDAGADDFLTKPFSVGELLALRGVHFANGRPFVASMELNGKNGGSDGVRCDVDGNVWSSAGWGGDVIGRGAPRAGARRSPRQMRLRTSHGIPKQGVDDG